MAHGQPWVAQIKYKQEKGSYAWSGILYLVIEPFLKGTFQCWNSRHTEMIMTQSLERCLRSPAHATNIACGHKRPQVCSNLNLHCRLFCKGLGDLISVVCHTAYTRSARKTLY